MAFGIGGSSSKTSSESTSYGYSGSASLNMSDSSSLGTSSSGAQSSSTQNIAFADLFKQLYGGAASVAGGLSGAPIGSAAEMLFSGGTDFLQSLQGGPAAGYLEQRISGQSPVLQEQIGALGDDLTKLFTDKLNPEITSRAVAGGTLGGGRQGVAQGVAMGEVAREFARGSTALRASDIAARDQAATNLMAQRTAAAGTGLNSLQSLLDIQQAGSLSALAPYQALSGILGGPTVLTQAQSTSESESMNTSEAIARAISASFGEDFSKSTSKSKSKSGSISF
jgi:hypothetical protein